jgi:hypothetical protein
MEQKIEPLNASEEAWVKTQLESAAKFVEDFSPDARQPLTLAALDRAFATWLASESNQVEMINSIINYVGIAFGQSLVDGLGLKWVVATDQHGCEMAVYGLPGRGDVLVYPANFVAKRWERREANFLEDAYEKIARDVRAVADQWRTSQP